MNKSALFVAVITVGLVIVLFAGSDIETKSPRVTMSPTVVPEVINYQGKLVDNTGVPVTATVSIVFSIYDVASGGTALWTETQSSVVVQDGIYNVLLGSTTPIPDAVFDRGDRWLGLKVGTDSEMTPRQRSTSVGYASNSDMVDGQHASEFAASSHDHDTRYYTEAELNTNDGTVNEPVDPVSWFKIKDVPAGFADGTDDEGSGVAGGRFDRLRVDDNSWITDSVTFIEGVNVDLTQIESPSGDTIVISAPFAGGDSDWNIIGNDMHSIPSGNVGIGTLAPDGKLTVHSTGNQDAGIFTNNGTGFGICSWSFNNYGVLGLADNTDGVHGISGNNPVGNPLLAGVAGESDNQCGVSGYSQNADGVHGISGNNPVGNPKIAGVAGESDNQCGVSGYSQNNAGVYGLSGLVSPMLDPRRAGVGGESMDQCGVSGCSENSDGVYGSMYKIGTYAIAPENIVAGVHGVGVPTNSADNFAVAGTGNGYGSGVLGIGSGKGHGVLGIPGQHDHFTTAGVRGITREGAGWPPLFPLEVQPDKLMVGVLGQASDMVGAWGESHNKIGVVGSTGDQVAFVDLPVEPVGVYGVASQDNGFGVFGKTTSASKDAAGVKGVGSATGKSPGILGITESDDPDAAGVKGVGSPTADNPGILGITESAHPGATGIRGIAQNANSQFGVGVVGITLSGLEGKGVHGAATNMDGQGVGVWGSSLSMHSNGAGVLARGNGVTVPGEPRAAALKIYNGAVRFTGDVTPDGPMRAMGKVFFGPPWNPMHNCLAPDNDGGADHNHNNGWTTGLTLMNPLITGESWILLTPEISDSGTVATVWLESQEPGQATVVVAIIEGVQCEGEPEYAGFVHYFIGNP